MHYLWWFNLILLYPFYRHDLKYSLYVRDTRVILNKPFLGLRFKSEKSFIRFCQIIFHCLTFNMNDISLIAMDCVAILGIASWFILIGHNQYGKLSKAELITLCWWPKCCWLFCHQHRCWLFKSQLVIGGLAEILTQRSFIWDFTCYWY